MRESQSNRKQGPLHFYNDTPLKLWLIPEIYGWIIVAMGFGFFLMMIVAAVAHLLDVGISFDSLFSLLQLAEGVTIGGGLIAFGTVLRRFVAVQATLCVIFLLVIIWFLYFFWVTGYLEYAVQSSLIGLAVMFPLALCVFVNRERLQSTHEPSQSQIDHEFYELQSKIPMEIYEEIENLCEIGEQFLGGAKYQQALEHYRAALKLVPEPVEEHDATLWIQAAIGDCYFLMGQYRESANASLISLSFPKALENPFIHLRLGQSFFEIGETEKAADSLARAYLLEGAQIFKDEDPKYFEFLKTRIRPPENGKW